MWLAPCRGWLFGNTVIPKHGGTEQLQEKKKRGAQPVKMAPPALLIDAKKESLIGNFKAASEKFTNITERFPDDPVAYYELARIRTILDNIPEALENARKATRLDPENIWYHHFLGELCLSTGRLEEATELYKKLSSLQPGNSEYLYQLASLYMQSEKFRDAISALDQVEEKIGISEEIILQKEKIYRHLGDRKSAEREIRKLINTFPMESRYYSIMAEFHMSGNQPEKALEMYRKVAEIDPDNAYVHMSLADFYRKAGDQENAFRELKLGFATPNLDIDTKINILLSFYTVNQIYGDLKSQSFELLKILMETHPRDPKGYSIYGDFLVQDKQYPEARETFLNVLSIDSSRYIVWEQILQLDLQLSEYNQLVSHGNRTIELFPEQPLPYLFTGIGLMQLKRHPEALKVLKNGEKLVADNSDLQSQFCMYQGDILHAMKKDEEAFQAYEKSLALKDNNPYVLNNYSYYLSLKGKDLEKAERMSKKSLELEPDNPSFQDTYGWILFMLGRYQEAAIWIGKAVNNSEEEPSGEVLEHYGDVLFKLNDTAGALEYWNKALMKGDVSDLLQKKINDKKYYP